MARKRNKPFYEKVRIEDIGSEGKALTRIGDMVVFTKLAVPGDIVDLQVTRKRKNYQEAIVTKIHKFSNDRAEAFCAHFGVCGGCKWQYLPYKKQLHFKQKQVVEQLKRIGKVTFPQISPILGSAKDTFYRNKLEFTFSNKKWLTPEEISSKENFSNTDSLGFHAPGMFDKIINIDKCWLQAHPSNAIRNFIYKFSIENQLDFFDIRAQKGFLRTLIIRTSTLNETMVILSFFRDEEEPRKKILEALKNEFPEITSLLYVINTKGNDTITDQHIIRYSGRDSIYEEMEGLKFKIGAKSFYQTNSEQAYRLYSVARKFAELTGNEIVYDLYTGTGTIANFIARNTQKVIGVEFVPEAITDAKSNTKINNIENTYFYAGDIKEIINKEFIRKHGRPDIVITDPPRAGMHADVIKSLINLRPYKIIYISCNPATQARDISFMSDHYTLDRVQPVDMFPHTHHVENVILLKKK